MNASYSEIKMIKNNNKGLLFILAFRASSAFTKSGFLRIIGLPVRLCYKVIIQWILGIDVPDTTSIGQNFNVYHGTGLVIHSDVLIGDNVTVRHNTTIGNARENGGCPRIGNNINIGANSVIIGDIQIGDNAVIAAGSVVIRDVPANVVVAGNPATVVKYLKHYEKV